MSRLTKVFKISWSEELMSLMKFQVVGGWVLVITIAGARLIWQTGF